MKLLLLSLVMINHVHATTKLVTIPESRYAFQVMRPDTPITKCIYNLEIEGIDIEIAAKLCIKLNEKGQDEKIL